MTTPDPTAGRLAAQAIAHRAARLESIATMVVDQGRHGEHAARQRVVGAEFAEHRSYVPGDDLRLVDWRTAARSERLVVKRQDTQRAAVAEILLDASRSMDYGSVTAEDEDVPATKVEAAAMLAAIHGYRWLRRGDTVVFSRVSHRAHVTPGRSGAGQLSALCTDVARALPADADGADLEGAIAAALARLRRPGIVLLLTDALDAKTRWIDQLGHARARGHGVAVIQVIDPAERELPFDESARFVDPETGLEVRTSPARVRRTYRAMVEAHLDDVRRRLLDAGVHHQLVTTGVPLRTALLGIGPAEPRT
jgi:uncharacterized protein (DUF58 family)